MKKRVITGQRKKMLLTVLMVFLLGAVLWAVSGIRRTVLDDTAPIVWEPVNANPWMEIAAINQAMLAKLPFSVNGKITLREWEDGPVQEERNFFFQAYDSCCSLYRVDSAATILRGKHFNATCFDGERYATIDQNKGKVSFQEWLDTALLQKQFGTGAKDVKVFADNKGNRMICSDLVTGNGINGIIIQYSVPTYAPSLVKMSLAGTSIPSAKDSVLRVPVLETTYQTTQPLSVVEHQLTVLHHKIIDTQSVLRIAGGEGYRLIKP